MVGLSPFGSIDKQRIPFGLKEDAKTRQLWKNGLKPLHSTTFSISCICWKPRRPFAVAISLMPSYSMNRQFLLQGNIGKHIRWSTLVIYIKPSVVSDSTLCFLNIIRFVNEEALACELAGYFFLEIDDKDLAIQYFLQAHEAYHNWGAVAKSNSLFEFVQRSLLLPTLSTTPDLSLSIASTNNGQSIGSDDTNQRKRGVDS